MHISQITYDIIKARETSFIFIAGESIVELARQFHRSTNTEFEIIEESLGDSINGKYIYRINNRIEIFQVK